MDLFRRVLTTSNPFPHGLFWAAIKGSKPLPVVNELLLQARAHGVDAHFVPIETFDALLLRLWRNTEGKSEQMDARVRKVASASVSIPLPKQGRAQPLIRLNALPIRSLPGECLELKFKSRKNWEDVNKARVSSENKLILTKAEAVWCFGSPDLIAAVFGEDLQSIATRALPADLGSPNYLYAKGFIEEALCRALARKKPLQARVSRYGACLIADGRASTQADLQALVRIVGPVSGTVPRILAPPTEDHPIAEKVSWAESLKVSLDFKDGQPWLLLEPDIWIEPTRARRQAVEFLDARRADRYNKKFNELLDAWVHVVLGTKERNAEVIVSLFEDGIGAQNPEFRISSRTAFARRIS
jgi:hypothetical protein